MLVAAMTMVVALMITMLCSSSFTTYFFGIPVVSKAKARLLMVYGLWDLGLGSRVWVLEGRDLGFRDKSLKSLQPFSLVDSSSSRLNLIDKLGS